jgi:hypothetical protein
LILPGTSALIRVAQLCIVPGKLVAVSMSIGGRGSFLAR